MTIKEHKEIITRLSNLEKAFIQSQQNGVIQTQTVDKNKMNISNAQSDIEAHTETITQTEDALCEVDNNITTMLAEIQDALCEIDERLSESEE